MDNIRFLIQSKFNAKKPLARQVQLALIVEKANEVIKHFWGEKMQDKVKAVSLKNGIMKFYGIDSVVCQELRFKQNSIISQINEKFGENTVKRLKIVQKSLEKLAET